MEDVDLLVLHQANVRIMDAAVEGFSIPRERVVVNVDRYGNTSAASVPLALDEAHRQGKIARGSLVLLCGFGSGLTWGTALVRW
jgi:3-oxoacyl-[acyl-carrier-protein] synthase-3